MNEYRFTVIVKTDTQEHADQVIAERVGFDEELTDEAGVEFDYSIEQESFPASIKNDEPLAEDEPNPVGDAPNDVLFFAKQAPR